MDNMKLPAFALSTPRLQLRRLVRDDLPAMVAYRSQPSVARYQSWTPAWSMRDAVALFEADQATVFGTPGTWTQLALVEHGSGASCGDVALHFDDRQPDTIELGVTLSPAHQGRGLAAEALRAVVSWAFDTRGAHRVFAQADARNTAVRRLFARLGFRQEAELRDAEWWKGEWTTLCVYAALAPEWAQLEHARGQQPAP